MKRKPVPSADGGPPPLAALIVVEHGAAPRPALERALARLRARGTLLVERVRNDVAPGVALADPNEALEFSGYQEGLARVLARLQPAPEQPLTLVFANDTLASGHPAALARLLLDALPCLAGTHTPRLSGLVMPVSPAMALVTGMPGYVSTWAFALQAPAGVLGEVRFYGAHEVMGRFEIEDGALPGPYLAWMREWLEPRHWLRGWYKACPGRQLDAATRRRKELAIYLEHRLPRRLAALGFEMVDLGELLSGPRAAWLALLRRADRLNVNRLKLRHRLPHALRRAFGRAITP